MQIKRNALDVIEAVVSLLCLIGIPIYLVLMWQTIPDQVPGHYGITGVVDRWGSKSELLLVPILSWVLFGLVSLVERNPKDWNTGVAVTEENQVRVYRTLKNMIAVVKMLVLVLFASLTVNTSLCQNLPVWFIIVFLGAVFGTIAFFKRQLSQMAQEPS